MSALILLRHAKSDWTEDMPDRARPLAPRGLRATGIMGRFLASSDDVADIAMTSPAIRARETLRLVLDAAGWTCPITESERLYGEGVEGLLGVVRAQPDSVRTMIAVGHEPTWSDAVGELTGGSRVRMPTAGMARIDFDEVAWSQVEPGAGLLTWLVTPRILE